MSHGMRENITINYDYYEITNRLCSHKYTRNKFPRSFRIYASNVSERDTTCPTLFFIPYVYISRDIERLDVIRERNVH